MRAWGVMKTMIAGILAPLVMGTASLAFEAPHPATSHATPRASVTTHATAPAVEAEHIQWIRETIIEAKRPAPRTLQWTCEAPRALETDATQTVKVCEWR